MNKRLLAVEILNDQFGDIIGKVGSILLEQGPQTMTDLIQSTSFQFPQVRNALLVLIQHNMCTYFDKNIYQHKLDQGSKSSEEEDDMKTQTEKLREQEEKREKWKHKGGGGASDTAPIAVQGEEEESETIKAEKQKQFERQSKIIYYQIVVENIIMRLKSAKLLYTIKTNYGVDGEELLHILLQHGRLTMQELIQKALKNITQNDYTFSSESKKTSFITAFQKMVKDRYIKRVQPYLSSIQLKEQQKNAKEGTNSTTDLLQKYSNKQNKEPSEKSSKSKKRKTIDDDDDTSTTSQYESAQKKKKKSSSTEISPLTFDNEELDSFDEDDIHIDAENILWTTNYSQFIRTFRNESIIKYVENKMGEQFASIVKSAFDETAPYQRSKNDPMSTPLKFDKLYDRVSESEEIGRKVLENNLSFLCNPELDILRAMGKDTYFINLKGVADKLKKQETEVIITQKYSVIGCRLFRLLLEKKYLEQTHIAECALLPPCEARTLLMNMLRGSILHLQEVPKSKDRSAQQTFFLWSVKLDQVYEKIIDDMYKSVRNLRIRLKKEQQHIIESGILESTYLSEEQEEQIRRLKNIEDRLEASLIKLVDLVTLFEDF